MKYNQWIDFSGEWASTKTVEAFIAHEKHHGLSEQELRDIHALILIEHGDNTGSEKEVVTPENLTEHGDNIGIQEKATGIATGGSRKRRTGNNRRQAGGDQPGADAGGQT